MGGALTGGVESCTLSFLACFWKVARFMKHFSPLLAFWRSVSCDTVAFLRANAAERRTPEAFVDTGRWWEMMYDGVDDQLWNITKEEATTGFRSGGGRNLLSASDPARLHFLVNYRWKNHSRCEMIPTQMHTDDSSDAPSPARISLSNFLLSSCLH